MTQFPRRGGGLYIRKTRREASGLDPTEHVEGVRLMRAVRYHYPTDPKLKLLYHIPNGGWRNRIVAAKLKAEGVKRGVADYCLPVARCGFHGLYIELKTLTGSADPEQVQFKKDVEAEGYMHVVCRGWQEAWTVLCAYLGVRNRINGLP